MSLKFFSIPAASHSVEHDLFDTFCAEHKITDIDKQFIADGANSFWAICVTYAGQSIKSTSQTNTKVDYSEVLNAEHFDHFSKLRDLRTQLAKKEGKPASAIFNNAQLAQMVQKSVETHTDLRKIDGVGEAKVEKYAEPFLNLLYRLQDNTNPDEVL